MNKYLKPFKEKQPKVKLIRRRFIIKNGKEEEIEEDPGNQVIYKTIKYGNENDP